jgi:membrane protease YdiL (CAAX protease family)
MTHCVLSLAISAAACSHDTVAAFGRSLSTVSLLSTRIARWNRLNLEADRTRSVVMPKRNTMPQPAIIHSRLISWSTLALVAALYVAINFLVVFVMFPSGALRVLTGPTGGLVSGTLLANALLLAVVVGALRWRSGLTASDVGLGSRGFLAGAVVTALVWTGINLMQTLWSLDVNGSVLANPDWTQVGASRTVGVFLAQILGNALLEEILFRGVLFEQLRLHWSNRGAGVTRSPLVALVVSQAAFAVIHVPLRLSSGMSLEALPGELALLFGLGMLLALLYWRTANLYVCVGVHALSNAPLLLVKQQVDISTNGMIAAVASVIVILIWPRRRDAALVLPASG